MELRPHIPSCHVTSAFPSPNSRNLNSSTVSKTLSATTTLSRRNSEVQTLSNYVATTHTVNAAKNLQPPHRLSPTLSFTINAATTHTVKPIHHHEPCRVVTTMPEIAQPGLGLEKVWWLQVLVILQGEVRSTLAGLMEVVDGGRGSLRELVMDGALRQLCSVGGGLMKMFHGGGSA
ncbi:hypothetical protein LR48_Vigan07g114700 [Vigna angularis]|uniref:Uncharacterized protein n=1 Tax=Phaseolus angularis TaxID=3914 RepID=A0A0L9UXH1_PHAAN|nr:hypothetical protein LR48_Vigan07g114700 [Vigna angularis]